MDFKAKKWGFIQENPQKRDFSHTWGCIQEWRCIEADTVSFCKINHRTFLILWICGHTSDV